MIMFEGLETALSQLLLLGLHHLIELFQKICQSVTCFFDFQSTGPQKIRVFST